MIVAKPSNSVLRSNRFGVAFPALQRLIYFCLNQLFSSDYIVLAICHATILGQRRKCSTKLFVSF
jgi:hypothetical protein